MDETKTYCTTCLALKDPIHFCRNSTNKALARWQEDLAERSQPYLPELPSITNPLARRETSYGKLDFFRSEGTEDVPVLGYPGLRKRTEWIYERIVIERWTKRETLYTDFSRLLGQGDD